jgi:acyl carrier protein
MENKSNNGAASATAGSGNGNGEGGNAQKVVGLLAKQLGKDAAKIKPTDRIMEDLGADSLDIVEMLMGLEETYGIVIPDDDAMNLKTVGDLVSYLDKYQE